MAEKDMEKSPHDMNGEKAEVFPRDFIKVKSPSGSEEVHYSLFYEGLPDEYRLFVQEVLNETEENKQMGLKKLREFMEKEKLPPCPEHDIIGVLRCSKYNIKKAETKLKKYLKHRQKIIQLLASMDDSKTELILEDALFAFLPYRDKHGSVILVTQPNVRFDLYQMEDIFPVLSAAYLYVNSFPLSTACGYSFIGENKTDNLYIYYPILRGLGPFINGFLDSPIRYGTANLVNENMLITAFYWAIRPILPKKLKQRVFFHGKGYRYLKKTFHPDILPENFEGNLEPLSNKYFRERLLDFIKKLKAENEIVEP